MSDMMRWPTYENAASFFLLKSAYKLFSMPFFQFLQLMVRVWLRYPVFWKLQIRAETLSPGTQVTSSIFAHQIVSLFSGHTGTATVQQDLPSGSGRLSPTGFVGKFVQKNLILFPIHSVTINLNFLGTWKMVKRKIFFPTWRSSIICQ